jgi:hypothetical protein
MQTCHIMKLNTQKLIVYSLDIILQSLKLLIKNNIIIMEVIKYSLYSEFKIKMYYLFIRIEKAINIYFILSPLLSYFFAI